MTEPKLIARHDFFFPVPRDDNGIPVAQLVKIDIEMADTHSTVAVRTESARPVTAQPKRPEPF
jgi:hypothetical protein